MFSEIARLRVLGPIQAIGTWRVSSRLPSSFLSRSTNPETADGLVKVIASDLPILEQRADIDPAFPDGGVIDDHAGHLGAFFGQELGGFLGRQIGHRHQHALAVANRAVARHRFGVERFPG